MNTFDSSVQRNQFLGNTVTFFADKFDERGLLSVITIPAAAQAVFRSDCKLRVGCEQTGMLVEWVAAVCISRYSQHILGQKVHFTFRFKAYKERYLSSLSLLNSDRAHWPDADNHFVTLEATGYALLALLKCGRVHEAAAPFRWLNQQRQVGGGYGSTQVSVTNEFSTHISIKSNYIWLKHLKKSPCITDKAWW